MKTALCVAAFFAVLPFLLTAPVRAQGVDAEKGIKEAAIKLQPGTYYWAEGAWQSMEQSPCQVVAENTWQRCSFLV